MKSLKFGAERVRTDRIRILDPGFLWPKIGKIYHSKNDQAPGATCKSPQRTPRSWKTWSIFFSLFVSFLAFLDPDSVVLSRVRTDRIRVLDPGVLWSKAEKITKLLEQPVSLHREHPALKNMKYFFLLLFWCHFSPFLIQIRHPDPLPYRFGSTKLLEILVLVSAMAKRCNVERPVTWNQPLMMMWTGLS